MSTFDLNATFWLKQRMGLKRNRDFRDLGLVPSSLAL